MSTGQHELCACRDDFPRRLPCYNVSVDEFRILLFHLPREFSGIEGGLFSRPPFVVDHAVHGAVLLHRLETTSYGLILVDLPADGVDLPNLLPRVRGPGKPNARCILILLTAPERVEEQRVHLGRGLNAVFSRTAPLTELEAEIARQIQVAPRIDARFAVRVRIEVRPSMICQSFNVSVSGMFLISPRRLPVGSAVRFEMALPEARQPVCGPAVVVRHADPALEKFEGMALAFSSFEGDGREVLQAFLNR